MNEEEVIVRIRHIGWIGYQIAAGQPYNVEINEDQMESLLDGIRFLKAHPDTTPEENHKNWMKEKTRQGWIYGPKKDFEKKTHPDLVPYDELPEIEKRKDTAIMIIHREAEKLLKDMKTFKLTKEEAKKARAYDEYLAKVESGEIEVIKK